MINIIVLYSQNLLYESGLKTDEKCRGVKIRAPKNPKKSLSNMFVAGDIIQTILGTFFLGHPVTTMILSIKSNFFYPFGSEITYVS